MRYAMLLAFVIAVVLDVVFALQGDVHWYNLVAALVLVPAIFGLVFGFVCLSWRTRILPVSFLVTSDGVTVMRDGAELAHYSRASIRGATFVGVMDYRAIVTRLTYNPSWPHLRIEITDGVGTRRVDLPEIMIWGRKQARATEDMIQRALWP
jgi:hypothetical protein